MQESNLIKRILVEKKITDFLEARGFSPARTSANRLVYHCPIHEGDNDPSFVVYLNGDEHQTYFCYGCKSGTDIINLLCDLDKLTIKEAIKILLEGVDIQEEGVGQITDRITNYLDSLSDFRRGRETKEIEKILLEMGVWFRNHLRRCPDEEEKEFFVKVFKSINEVVMAEDIETLNEMKEIIHNKLGRRVELYKEREEKRNIKKHGTR